MAVQFGRWSFDGRPADAAYLARIDSLLEPYGSDGHTAYSQAGVQILYRAFHTTRASRSERQPYALRSGAVLTWDGRLDNRADWIRELNGVVTQESPDVLIVAAAYERTGTRSFSTLLGDWALSIWEPGEQTLLLAKDPIGVRPLYYARDENGVTWSSVLDPLVLGAHKAFALDREYIAGWFSTFPAADSTPYLEIRSVLAASFLQIEPRKQMLRKYWDFDPNSRIRYATDREYEEHFRLVFREAVGRRLRTDAPVLAELSGGLDSSSIVCIADQLMEQGAAETPRLDTVSCYNDSEPNWNERPYFRKVEERRGRAGCHIDLSSGGAFAIHTETPPFAPTPSAECRMTEATEKFNEYLLSGGHRVLLSGIGGDEVTGGVPTPCPELADLLTRGHLRRLASQLLAWAIQKRQPWIHLLGESCSDFLPPGLTSRGDYSIASMWLDPRFAESNRPALTDYRRRLRFFGPLPSVQYNGSALEHLRRQLASASLPAAPPYEKRYPYLDRNFLEFLFALPREQLVRPGHRRSLMRRALAGFVPAEILDRKRKAYVARAPLASIADGRHLLLEISRDMRSAALGIIDPARFRATLEDARLGKPVPSVLLIRTLHLELWLRAASPLGVLTDLAHQRASEPFSTDAEGVPGSTTSAG
jgi:asparagine synthase (glutamine-hydrolysing)